MLPVPSLSQPLPCTAFPAVGWRAWLRRATIGLDLRSGVGRALIGARVGDTIRVVVPGHGAREYLLAELAFQPEASGRFDL